MTKMTWYARAAPAVPESTMAMPSRIGTAPLRPVHRKKTRSAHGEPDRQRDQAAEDRADHERQQGREGEAVGPGGRAGSWDSRMVRPSMTNATISARLRERGVEPLDLPLVGGGLVADDDAGHQDREEPRALGDRGDAEDDQHAGQHPGRVEPLARQRHPAHEREQRQPAGHPDRHPDGHLQRELGHHVPDDAPAAAVRREQRRRAARSRPGRWRRTRPRAAPRCARRSRGGRTPRTPPPGRSRPPRCRPAGPGASPCPRRSARPPRCPRR